MSIVDYVVRIRCPLCSKTLIISAKILENLPTDHRVTQLMDYVSCTSRKTETFCSKHICRALNFFCETCMLPVCAHCIHSNHQDKEHVVIDLPLAEEKYRTLIFQEIEVLKGEVLSLEDRQFNLIDNDDDLDRRKDQQLKLLHSSFQRLHEALQKREDEAKQLLEREVY